MSTTSLIAPTTLTPGIGNFLYVLADSTGKLLVVDKNSGDILAAVDGIETLIGSTNTKLDSLISAIGSSSTPIRKVMAVAASGSGTIWMPATDKKTVVTDILISCDTTGSLILYSGSFVVANYFYKGWFVSNGGSNVHLVTPMKGTNNTALNYVADSAFSGFLIVLGYEE